MTKQIIKQLNNKIDKLDDKIGARPTSHYVSKIEKRVTKLEKKITKLEDKLERDKDITDKYVK